MRTTKWILTAAVLLTLGCGDYSDSETHRQHLAVSGPWQPPSDVVAQADSYDIGYTGAGPWVGTSGCGGSFTEGGRQFKTWVENHWPQVEHIGGYSCRPINGNASKMSVHATGRALDIHIPLDGGEADNDLGDPLANWLLVHADEIGIQIVIWDRWIWSSSNSSRAYTGAHPHHDHLHVELTPEASRLETPWFSGDMPPPELPGCDEPLPGEGGVVDDASDCFQAFGSPDFWRIVEGEGVGDSLRWTNAFESESPSNWARWRLNVGEAGTYRVDYYRVGEYARFDSTRYSVKFGDQTEEIYVDLSAGEDGWQTLGEWEFEAGKGQWIAVHDDHLGPVAEEQHVIADAIRLVVPGSDDPDEDVTDMPDPADDDLLVPSGDDADYDPSSRPSKRRYPDSVAARGGCIVASDAPTPTGPPLLIVFLGGCVAALRRRRG